MGIPKLNKWLLSNCSPQSIRKTSLLEFQDKRVAVDISIYLYRFLADNRFMEQLYLFLSILKYYCIQPVIIFDGKAPPEKKNTIAKRHKDKQEAKQQYGILQQQLTETKDEHIRNEITNQMLVLKKKMIRITWAHIDSAIELIQAFGFEYYLAPHEADQLCIYLANIGNVYAILSDDMDLIVSGAPRILRCFSMSTHNIILYDTQSILIDIQMNIQDFRATVILSGTDYEVKTQYPNFNIKRCFELYQEYKITSKLPFVEWLGEKGIIEPQEYRHICSLFDTDNVITELSQFVEKNRPTTKPKMNITTIRTIMSKYNFIFLT
jgi:5'-3' exonuclease